MPRTIGEMTDERPVHLTAQGPPSTVLDPESVEAVQLLRHALQQPAALERDAVAAVVARFPAFLDGWAQLGRLARDDVEAYACFRVGYHRGLDRLRASGWRGSGYVRWDRPENIGFLRSLRGLGLAAARIGETAEAERCAQFLLQLDPGGVPAGE